MSDRHARDSRLGRTLTALRTYEPELRAAGVQHAAIFGSVARGDDRPDSDLDVLVDVTRGNGFGILHLVGIKLQLEDLLGCPVDVVTRGALTSPRHDHILADVVPAF
jgi:predicted nucleotidyltransferase